ncbi:histone-lysine N-methyltransferase SETMAR [Trichonephila clavipes]|nr:histone-lysine N-methyltransferase SETMAR [Trichonephila clavipes]
MACYPFLTARNMSAADIHLQITEVYGTEAMSDNKIRKWVGKFKNGRTNVHVEFTITTLSLEFPDVSRSVVFKIVTEGLNFKKLCSRWVPRLITAEHKEKCAISLDFLIRCAEERDEVLSQIITGDKTWVSRITPESKQKSMECRNSSSPVKVKAKQTLSERKIMATVF